VNFLSDTVGWLTTADNWWGTFGILNRLIEHIRYSVAAVVVATVIALPLGLWLGHLRRFGTLAINVANLGRALPSFAILALSLTIFGLDELPFAGPVTAFVALVALAIPPILINAYTGMAEVPDGVRDAARGMGHTGFEQVRSVELPNALPLVLAGIRTSAVQVIATATLAALVGAGGLGRFIIDGMAIQDDAQLAGGAVLVAALAIVTELGFAGLQRFAVSPGVRARAPKGAPVAPYPS
jgi:osmoprotectant transport system permease protein